LWQFDLYLVDRAHCIASESCYLDMRAGRRSVKGMRNIAIVGS